MNWILVMVLYSVNLVNFNSRALDVASVPAGDKASCEAMRMDLLRQIEQSGANMKIVAQGCYQARNP